ncbi:MAG: PH domain-containing protein [Thermoplasmatota archaeon]
MTTAPGLGELDRFVNRRELDALTPMLSEGESIRFAMDGASGGRRGVLAATDRRILFVSKGLLRRHVQEWDLDDVTRVDVEAGVDDATLTLHSYEPFVLTGARKAAASGFQEAVRLAIPQRTFRRARIVRDPRMADPVEEGGTTIERLRRLERMRARKSITEPEYKVNRRRILEDAGLPTDLRH